MKEIQTGIGLRSNKSRRMVSKRNAVESTVLTAFEEEKHVRYVSSVERLGYERGREESLAENLAVLMKARFGAAGLRLLPKVQSLRGEKELRMFFEFAITAKTVKELRDYLSER